MAGAAAYYLVLCLLEGQPDMAHGALYAVVESSNPGVEITGEWDTLGMRATVSPGSRFTDCFIGAGDVLGEPGEIIGSGIFDFFGIGHAAVYLGIAQGAFNATVDYCRTTAFRPSTETLAADPMIQRHIGEMAIQLDAARLLLQRAVTEWPEAPAARRAELSAQAKHAAGEAGLAVTSQCLQVCGGRSASKSMPVERAYRDIRTATLMPPNADTMLGTIGRGALGLGAEGFRFG
jgi:alkylation response protein AidB-like acyl-CoA dehydrogenase